MKSTMKYTLEQTIVQVAAKYKPRTMLEHIEVGVEAYKRFIQPEIDALHERISDYEWKVNPEGRGR